MRQLFSLVVLLLACSNEMLAAPDIGKSCDLQTQVDPTNTIVTAGVLACWSRLCIRPAGTADTTAFCTGVCSSDRECAQGERRSSTVADDRRCKSGFSCRVLTEVGSLANQKVCVCDDFPNIK